ncbi:MAG: class I SAM-dependent methyltransferase [Paracoccaceae bacterium]|nr:class I SAM-dependent methyltransferase [Paracoccaceae bacterium]
MKFNNYDDPRWVARNVRKGKHREAIGGLWDKLGNLQFECLTANGLKPEHKLLDIGCGALRLGALAVPYLMPGNYYGTDINKELFVTGWEKEIDQKERLPIGNMTVDNDFSFDGVPKDIDFAIANSVFTHLPINHLRRCLLRIGKFPRLKNFFFTVFLVPEGGDVTARIPQKGGIVSYDYRDPFHCTRSDIDYVAKEAGYSVSEYDWEHPRNQKMFLARPLKAKSKR